MSGGQDAIYEYMRSREEHALEVFRAFVTHLYSHAGPHVNTGEHERCDWAIATLRAIAGREPLELID